MSTANEDEHSEIEMLLPWHAAGTLSPRETQRVEAALARDPELARRYELVRDELGQTIRLNEALGAPSARAMEKLFAKIDAEPARKPALSQIMAIRIGEFFAGLSPRMLAWSASAAALAILLQAGFIAGFVLKQNSESGYGTASAPANVTADGTYALIRFAPQASAEDITKFLETNKLSIADGPAAGGLYRVRIAGTKLPRTELTRIIKTLQIDPVVGLIAVPE
jgi:anti-sigma factor RsiW